MRCLIMDLRSSIRDFVARAKELGVHLQSPAAATLTRADLHTLEVQLYLLEKQVQEARRALQARSELPQKGPAFPPYFSTEGDDEG